MLESFRRFGNGTTMRVLTYYIEYSAPSPVARVSSIVCHVVADHGVWCILCASAHPSIRICRGVLAECLDDLPA